MHNIYTTNTFACYIYFIYFWLGLGLPRNARLLAHPAWPSVATERESFYEEDRIRYT
jgi:hypothetical protein